MKFYDGDETLTRAEALALLIEIWGDECFLCKEPPTQKDVLNIEHFFVPYSVARRWGWRESQYNAIENLRPAHESCNRMKADTIVDSHDWVFVKPVKSVKEKKTKPQPCGLCENGRWIDYLTQCDLCGLDNSVRRFPASTQKKPVDCSHEFPDHCYVCVVHPELLDSKPAT